MAARAQRSNAKKVQKHVDASPSSRRLDLPRWAITGLVILIVATVAIYLPVHHQPFLNFDDDKYITDNPHVKAGLTAETIAWAFTSYDEANWHPLTWLSHAADYQFFELNPAGHHDTNLILHALNVVLLFWVLWRATGYPGRSLMVAGLFALHPINVESVAWVAERKNLLSMVFFLLGLEAYRWYVTKPGIGRYTTVVLSFACGLMAKPQVVTFPFVLLLWDYWPLRRLSSPAATDANGVDEPDSRARSFLWLVTEKVPLFLLCVASAVITMRAQYFGGGLDTNALLTDRLANAMVSYVRYLQLAFWPARLALMYPQNSGSIRPWEAILASLLLVAITGLALWYRRYRYLPVGWFCFLGTLVPMIGIVQVGRQAMADRYAYLSFVGLFIALTWVVVDGATPLRVPLRWEVAASVVVLASLATVTWRQVRFWGDNISIWSHTLQVTGRNYLAEDSLGRALQAEGRSQEAVAHFANAIEIEPTYVFPYVHIGIYLHQQGDLQGALENYRKVISLTENQPRFDEVRHRIFVNMASAYASLQDWQRAVSSMQSALRLNPDDPQEWTNMGTMAQRAGAIDQAIDAYSQALKLRPSRNGYLLLASALEQAGRKEEAQAVLREGSALSGVAGPER